MALMSREEWDASPSSNTMSYDAYVAGAPKHLREQAKNSANTANSASTPVTVEDFFQQYNEAARQAEEQTRAWNAEQAQKQMDFQREMANTQYQRAAADMKAAGLNPYMLMSGAHSSAAPSGSMATSSAPGIYSGAAQDILRGEEIDVKSTGNVLSFLGQLLNAVAKLAG